MFLQRWIGLGTVVAAIWGGVLEGRAVACDMKTGPTQGEVALTLSLSADCTDAEREERAVEAAQVIDAFKRGKGVALSGVVIRGDLLLDALAVGSVPQDLKGVAAIESKEARVVQGAISIVDSIVHGAIRHQSAQGQLVFRGPVTFTGTRFEQTVDLSRSVFMQPVLLSGAIFLRESYFVQARFLSDVVGEKTAFGPHTRFHRARFYGPATFQQSGFSGLAEFLEVEFERDANFSRTYFKLGTGFSGSRFRGMADFSESLFDREAFFPFVMFEGDVFFRRATFRSTADFSNAEFQGRDDFAKVLFEGRPEFSGVKRTGSEKRPLGLENPKVQYAITLSLLLFSAMLIVYLIKSK
jgi:uncharacterized protein YjbI with pentapeptide repeats